MTPSCSNYSVLFVDDDPFYRELASEMLSGMGFNDVATAADGNHALSHISAESTPCDLIICDLNMPEMHGVEFIRHAAERSFRGGIVLLSGENRRMLETAYGVAKTHDVNILGAVSKPINPVELKEIISLLGPAANEKRAFSPQEPITESDLRDGIEGSSKNDVRLVYQPKVDVRSGKIVAVETLARWWNQERGVLGPGTFIPLAEKTGLIDELTNVIYRKAVEQVAQWGQDNVPIKAAVNFSVNSFSSQAFCEFLVDTVQRMQVPPNQLLLEITETQAMTIAVDCLESILGMRLNRFGLSIDDFGTGNSSLAQLKNIPFTELKVDRAFVTGVAQNESALAILEASISLARKLDMEIVAEGVETREDWDLIEQLGVDYVQGFYCARPMSNEDLMALLENWTGPH